MKIECLLHRNGGSHVDMDAPERHYHFKPSEQDPRHIAEVDVLHHAKALLRIADGYRAVDADELDAVIEPEPEVVLHGSSVHAAIYTILGGETVTLGELVRMAFHDSGLTAEQWNAQDDQDRNAYIDATLAELQQGMNTDAQPEIAAAAEPAEPETAHPDDAAQDAADGNQDGAVLESQLPAEPDAPEQDANSDGVRDDLENLTRKDLVPLYVERFGREPSSRMTVADIKRALSEED